jgi:hypothetical protein
MLDVYDKQELSEILSSEHVIKSNYNILITCLLNMLSKCCCWI